MEVTRKGWSERKGAIGDVLKFAELVQRLRIPRGQSDRPAGRKRALRVKAAVGIRNAHTVAIPHT